MHIPKILVSTTDTMIKYILLFLTINTTRARWVQQMENVGLHEGDMILTPSQQEALIDNTYASIKDTRKLWSTRYIPYMFSADINENAAAKKNVLGAMKEYAAKTCLRFYPRRNEMSYLHFYRGGGCNSPVGVRIGGNLISLSPGCWSRGSIVHEIGHSLGFYHEQARPDRDDYITINWENIRAGSNHNFNKQKSSSINSMGTKYDYSSIMHYSKTAFGNGRVTIVTKDSSMQDVIGQRNGLSKIDVKQLNLMYKCVKPTGTSILTTTSTQGTTKAQSTVSITTSKSITDKKPDGCTDKATNCKNLINNCQSSDRWKSFMRNYCQNTCKFC